VDGFSAGRTNSPLPLVVSVYTRPVSTSVMVTVAATMTPPVGSMTVPAGVDRSRCANSIDAPITGKKARQSLA
jgi:hypothetical protein